MLDLLGNWTEFKHDKNGTNGYADNGEDEDRTHNEANEITTIALNGLTGSPFTQHRDKAGNWTRNKRSAASNIEYTHDAWNRLVKVQTGVMAVQLKGQYEYNGLHWRTVRKVPSGPTVAERRMFYSGSWQLLEERIDSNNSGGFAEEKCAQTVWGLRYIDDAVLRRTDNDQDYDYADSGERTDYLITDTQFSVVAVVDDTGALQERVVYTPYGEATHHFPADIDGDGDVDTTDTNWFTNLNNLKNIDQTGYNADGDLDRDGSVDSADASIASGWGSTAALADGLLSDPTGPDNPVGYDGYLFTSETKIYTVRFRHYEPLMGRWLERDPVSAMFAEAAYTYCYARPVTVADPLGLFGIVFPIPIVRPTPIPAPIVRPVPIPQPIDIVPPLSINPPVDTPAHQEITQPLPAEEPAVGVKYDPAEDDCNSSNPCGNYVNTYKKLEKEMAGVKASRAKTCAEARANYEKVTDIWKNRWKGDRCHAHHGTSDGRHGQATTDASLRRRKFYNAMRDICNDELKQRQRQGINDAIDREFWFIEQGYTPPWRKLPSDLSGRNPCCPEA